MIVHPILPTLQPMSDPRELGGLLGLLNGKESPFPLRELRVRARIVGGFCRTVVEQRFSNPYDVALQATHIFPLPPDAAVTHMELRAGGVVVRAECREREQAKAAFEAARHRGHQSALLTQERSDVHTLTVTNIPPRADVSVLLTIIERLECGDGRFVWRFPTVVAPRFMPGSEISHIGDGIHPDTDRVPDASRISPPLRLSGGVTLDLEVRIDGPVSRLESTLHACRVDVDDAVRVAPAGHATLDRDFVLSLSCAESTAVAPRAYTDGEYTVVVVAAPTHAALTAVPRDAFYLIDISSSMNGQKLNAAKLALQAALHGLREHDRFSLIAFDDRFEVFQNEPCDCGDAALAAADRWVAALQPHGGTEMLPPLLRALDTPGGEDRARTILLITDGQAGNENELIAAVARRRLNSQVFTLGIDTAVNAGLLKRLARTGGGACELMTPRDNIEQRVAAFESCFGPPLLTHVTASDPAAPRDPEWPHTVHSVFAGRPAAFVVRGCADVCALSAQSPAGIQRWTLKPMRVDIPLGALWARQCVAELEDAIDADKSREAALRPGITEIALAHGIGSRYTAFVAIDERVTTTGERVTVVQPVELPADWAMKQFMGWMGSSPMASAGSMDLTCFRLTECNIVAAIDAPAPASNRSGLYERLRNMIKFASPPDDADTAIDSTLARTQKANGSFADDVLRTVAALVTLIMLGHTRLSGARRRTVQKAAGWLVAHQHDTHAAQALQWLADAESSGKLPPLDALADLAIAQPEGAWLRHRLAAKQA